MDDNRKNGNGKKLSKRQLGDLLGIIADSLSKGDDLRISELQDYFDRWQIISRKASYDYDIPLDNRMQFVKNFIYRFRTNKELREFLEIAYHTRIPRRLSKENMHFLALGIILSSKISLLEAEKRWDERNDLIHSIDIYNTNRDKLIDFLKDKSLFPDGYSIVDFADYFHIKLPITNDRTKLISILVEKLFDRPLSTREIGRWGLPEKGR